MEVKMEIRYGVSEYDLSINEYEVIIDGEDIIYYRDTDDSSFYQNDEKHLFKTRKEAEEFARKQRSELKETCEKAKQALESLEMLSCKIIDRRNILRMIFYTR